jgi:hypothetical protein
MRGKVVSKLLSEMGLEPIEGMKVYWVNPNVRDTSIWYIDTIDHKQKTCSIKPSLVSPRAMSPISLSELRTLAVKYWAGDVPESEFAFHYSEKPLRFLDWQDGIRLIKDDREVEFSLNDGEAAFSVWPPSNQEEKPKDIYELIEELREQVDAVKETLEKLKQYPKP